MDEPAPLRFALRCLNHFVRGSWAWLTLRPGSRPRRIARRFVIPLANRMTRHVLITIKANVLLRPFQTSKVGVRGTARPKGAKKHRDIFESRHAIRVSVIINTLNRADSLARNLEALRRQTYREFEVIVVNGPSTDNTDALLRNYSGDIRIGYCPDTNIGLSRNIGLQIASGDVVAFIDDDAVPAETWIERLALAYRQPLVAGVGGWVFNLSLARMEWRNCTCTRSGDISVNAELPVATYTSPGADPFLYLAGCNMSFRSSVLAEVGPFNEGYSYGYEDVQICRRLVDAGHRIVQLGESAVVYHSAAVNCWRDSEGAIRNPYFPLRARVIFALEELSEPSRRGRVVSRLEQVAEIWRNGSRDCVVRGLRTTEEHEIFLRQIDDALRDGIVASKQGRSRQTLQFSPASSFQHYRLIDDIVLGSTMNKPCHL